MIENHPRPGADQLRRHRCHSQGHCATGDVLGRQLIGGGQNQGATVSGNTFDSHSFIVVRRGTDNIRRSGNRQLIPGNIAPATGRTVDAIPCCSGMIRSMERSAQGHRCFRSCGHFIDRQS